MLLLLLLALMSWSLAAIGNSRTFDLVSVSVLVLVSPLIFIFQPSLFPHFLQLLCNNTNNLICFWKLHAAAVASLQKKIIKTKETQHNKARKILQRADNTFWEPKVFNRWKFLPNYVSEFWPGRTANFNLIGNSCEPLSLTRILYINLSEYIYMYRHIL